MIDTDMLVLLNCLASWGNFGTNTEILEDRKRRETERILEGIHEELIELNWRLAHGHGIHEHDEE